LLHLDVSARSRIRLEHAAALGQRHGAHVTGICVIDLPPPPLFYGDASLQVDPRTLQEVMTQMRTAATGEAAKVEALFRERLGRDGLSHEWRLVDGFAGETVALHARYADLVILGQPDPNADPGASGIPAPALLSSGRPVLLVPYAGDVATIGETVLVAWNASREAARAVNDALPLLREARAVTVLAVNPLGGIAGDGDVPAADIALHLARHGVKAEAAHTVAPEIPEGDAILDYAADIGADLIVAGGYGHSRMREFVFGGVTRSLLTEMTVPVFLSH
jgi:nucleotide-binding universal stress UspA family protein